mgnify:CR=1 FL=1
MTRKSWIKDEVTSKSKITEELQPTRIPTMLISKQTTMVRQYITASPQGEHKRETLEAETQLESEDEPTLLDILEDEEDYQDDDGTEEGDQTYSDTD